VPVSDWTLASSDYGEAFSAVIARDNYYGMQFHPERSAAVGAKRPLTFLDLCTSTCSLHTSCAAARWCA
jgi:glutamine amidotransferase